MIFYYKINDSYNISVYHYLILTYFSNQTIDVMYCNKGKFDILLEGLSNNELPYSLKIDYLHENINNLDELLLRNSIEKLLKLKMFF